MSGMIMLKRILLPHNGHMMIGIGDLAGELITDIPVPLVPHALPRNPKLQLLCCLSGRATFQPLFPNLIRTRKTQLRTLGLKGWRPVERYRQLECPRKARGKPDARARPRGLANPRAPSRRSISRFGETEKGKTGVARAVEEWGQRSVG